MVKPSNQNDDWDERKEQIIGLGERSLHKSYYPQLRQNIERLERFRMLLDKTSDYVILVGASTGLVVDANEAFGLLLNQPVDALIGRHFSTLGLGDTSSIFEKLFTERNSHTICGEVSARPVIVELNAGESPIWLELSYTCAMLDESCYGVIVGRDITERKRNHEMVAALLAEKDALLENTIVGIVMLRQRVFVSCNRRFEEMLGYPPGEMIGKSIRIIYPSEESFATFGEEAYRMLNQDHSFTGTLMFVRADGSSFWCEVTGHALAQKNPQGGSIWIFTDVTERKQAEDRVKFLAYHDALTGLPNLQLAQDRLGQAISFAEHSAAKIALMLVDLDCFKTVNDSLGHNVGDQLLVDVAKRLSECVDDTDTVSRQGGDEFLILSPNLADPDSCVALLAQMMLSLSTPFAVDGVELAVSASIGIAMYPEDGADFETLLKKAEMAMYRAKEAGRNTYRFFDEEMNDSAVDQLALHFGLRRALELGQFVLYFQPQIEISSGTLIGAEALIRWQHPELGLILPGRFIPAAEESGLIVPMGEWVLREACREAAKWQQLGGRDLIVAVNLSVLQFRRGDIEQSVMRALASSGIEPRLLELELTESILIQDTEKVLATVMRLKLMGVKLSIDDFGTGYSSLSYLKRFKVDKLKIDQSFVRDLPTDSDDAAIVRAVIQMARSLGLRTIAEGVEDRQTLDHLRLYHCDEAQGYFYAKPMSAKDFADYLVS